MRNRRCSYYCTKVAYLYPPDVYKFNYYVRQESCFKKSIEIGEMKYSLTFKHGIKQTNPLIDIVVCVRVCERMIKKKSEA